MTPAEFFQHFSIGENPFVGEEARRDAVFLRLASGEELAAGASHPEFEKILGHPATPTTSVVFGEKGSGKTALRLLIQRRVERHNAGHPQQKVLLAAYDDMNAALSRFHQRLGGKTPLESLQRFRLVDHVDAILALVVPRLVDPLLEQPGAEHGVELGGEARKVVRRMDRRTRQDLLLLQAVYDRAEQAEVRTALLRQRLGFLPARDLLLWTAVAWLGWVPAAAYYIAMRYFPGHLPGEGVNAWVLGLLAGLWLLGVFKAMVWNTVRLRQAARRLRRQVRVISRPLSSWVSSLRQLDARARESSALPLGESDEPRYGMLERLLRVLRSLGYTSLLVLIDRVDEPTLISGDVERMRAVVWPLLNHKLLQHEGVAFKLLLPLDLRYALLKESSAFFQQARLDKQHLVERLSWTGRTLMELCDARLEACRTQASREAGAPPVRLLDLFAEDVTERDVMEALEQMQQPRDAFKLVYRCVTEHCAQATSGGGTGGGTGWRVPRATLASVLRQEVERLQQLQRGIRPA
jgi:hypothetical protein